jgi:hypothetical protein
MWQVYSAFQLTEIHIWCRVGIAMPTLLNSRVYCTQMQTAIVKI